jgi:hypothetical protein
MKFFEKLMIEEYNEFLNEEMYRIEIKGITHDWMSLDDAKFDPPGKRYTKKEAEKAIKKAIKAGRGAKFIRMVKESDDLSGTDEKVLKRIFYKRIMKADRKGLDKLFKEFEKRQEQARKRQRFGFSNDEIDLLRSWFNERSQQLKLLRKYTFESLIIEAPIAAKGWTQDSIEKFGKTIGKDPKDKGFFDACVKRMQGKEGFDNEKARGFCAAVKDKAYGDPHWRGKGKTKAQVKKDTAGKEYEKK